jgi:hypothetical protein
LTEVLVKAEAVPSTLQQNKTTFAITNSWGGAVTVAGTTATTFTIVYNDIPQDVCVNALSGLTGWRSVARGSTSIGTFPLTSANATTICDDTSSNDISFTST